MTITSPGLAMSIASTGFAQSPAIVWTVTAFPAIFTFPQTEKISLIAPFRCMASLIFGVDTDSKISLISSSGFFLSILTSSGLSIAFLIAAAAAFTSAAFVILLPTSRMSAPAITASAAAAASRPPAAPIGSETFPAISLSRSTDFFPFICWSIPTCALRKWTPSLSSSTARSTGFVVLMKSAIIRTPYLSAALTASMITVSSESASTQTMDAPAFAAISTSSAPVSATFMSATIS